MRGSLGLSAGQTQSSAGKQRPGDQSVLAVGRSRREESGLDSGLRDTGVVAQ